MAKVEEVDLLDKGEGEGGRGGGTREEYVASSRECEDRLGRVAITEKRR